MKKHHKNTHNTNYNKVFGIGDTKTGTKSLGQSFQILGFKHKSWDRLLYEKAYLKGDYNTIFVTADRFDSFEDAPWCCDDFYKKLDKKYPNSKFILTIREVKGRLRSHESFFAYNRSKAKRIPPEYLKYLIRNYSEKRSAIISAHNKRNKDIMEYFQNRQDDLLVMNICKGDGWSKLCPFLDVHVPNLPFPHENKGGYTNDLACGLMLKILQFCNLKILRNLCVFLETLRQHKT